MNRKLCVFLYSEFSPACKTAIDYIGSLSYDFAAVVGMTFVSIDHQNIRDILIAEKIESVPCIVIQYIDGRNMLIEKDDVYRFIDTISSNLSSKQKPIQSEASHPTAPDPISVKDSESVVGKGDHVIVDRLKVSEVASAMQKAREDEMASQQPHAQRTMLS